MPYRIARIWRSNRTWDTEQEVFDFLREYHPGDEVKGVLTEEEYKAMRRASVFVVEYEEQQK